MHRGDDDTEKAFIDRLVRLVREMRKGFDARAQAMDLTFSRAQALLVIQRREGAAQTEIAEALDIETSSLNRLLDGLEESGFIERRARDGDKRVRCIFLTDHARARADRVLNFSEDLRAHLFEGIDEAELAGALRVLDRIAANMETGAPR